MATLKITRTGNATYAVETDTVLADGSKRADGCMALVGSTLRSVEKTGYIRVGGTMAITLGPIARAKTLGLRIGGSFTQVSK